MTPFKPVADGVRVAVRLTPKASRNAIAGIAESGQGEAVLKVMVTAVPEAGKANEALIKLLAKEWGVAEILHLTGCRSNRPQQDTPCRRRCRRPDGQTEPNRITGDT